MGWFLFITPRPQNNGHHQRGKASGLVHDNAAREVNRAKLQRPATGGPDPVNHGRINDQHPEAGKGHNKAKANALYISANDQGRGDDGKGHLKAEEHDLGEGASQAFSGHTVEEHLTQSAPVRVERATVTKSDGIAQG